MSRMSGFRAEATWDPANIADNDDASVEVTVPGAKLGDFAFASLDVDVSDLTLTANVTAEDTVTVVLNNATSGAVNLGSTTVRVKVVPYDVI